MSWRPQCPGSPFRPPRASPLQLDLNRIQDAQLRAALAPFDLR